MRSWIAEIGVRPLFFQQPPRRHAMIQLSTVNPRKLRITHPPLNLALVVLAALLGSLAVWMKDGGMMLALCAYCVVLLCMTHFPAQRPRPNDTKRTHLCSRCSCSCLRLEMPENATEEDEAAATSSASPAGSSNPTRFTGGGPAGWRVLLPALTGSSAASGSLCRREGGGSANVTARGGGAGC
jgi:hypothetical protein